MSVAASLGVDENATILQSAHHRWPSWCERESALSVVSNPSDLRAHLKDRPEHVDDVFRALMRLSEAGEPDATTLVCWLLVPGAVTIAARHRHLSPQIDELTAGHLWLAAAETAASTRGSMHLAILRATERRLQGELGVGDGARRAGHRTWSETVPADPTTFTASWSTPQVDGPLGELLVFFDAAISAGTITADDVQLLWELATTADELHRVAGRSNRRGGRRLGLTSHGACELVGRRRSLSRASIARRASAALEHLTDFADADHFAGETR